MTLTSHVVIVPVPSLALPHSLSPAFPLPHSLHNLNSLWFTATSFQIAFGRVASGLLSALPQLSPAVITCPGTVSLILKILTHPPVFTPRWPNPNLFWDSVAQQFSKDGLQTPGNSQGHSPWGQNYLHSKLEHLPFQPCWRSHQLCKSSSLYGTRVCAAWWCPSHCPGGVCVLHGLTLVL